VSEDALVAERADGRTITVPLAWFPGLAHGTPTERANWRLIAGGEGIHWPDLAADQVKPKSPSVAGSSSDSQPINVGSGVARALACSVGFSRRALCGVGYSAGSRLCGNWRELGRRRPSRPPRLIPQTGSGVFRSEPGERFLWGRLPCGPIADRSIPDVGQTPDLLAATSWPSPRQSACRPFSSPPQCFRLP
jgi:hypothetical protein